MQHEERAPARFGRSGRAGRLSRRAIGAIIAAGGSLLCAVSAYLSWYGDRAPFELPIRHLVETGTPAAAAGYWTSVAAPLAVVGGLGALGALVRFRLLIGLGWMIGVATLVLWGLMRAIGDATDNAPAWGDVRYGVWVCVAGLVALMVGIAVMGPRREEVDAPLSMFDGDS
ncbi:hypothetical protein [Jiangella asiatica]|uniref:Uncharacterized protein n=1 Tax=Jiangella asiatica TaxID=2530372 RepID=A0A4R5CLC3_9ACTN|nr:hypothetical protein [Jiangella asiatica]TDD98254.1 hypothetical protein E1269_28855 [Jiangella asiatica]